MITILTPTYNRAELLKRLYYSLCEQSCFDFEWLVIDDGSEDETLSVVQSMLAEKRFSVRYIHKENGGKHTALNTGIAAADGSLVFIADSDDRLTFDAVEKLCQWAAIVEGDETIAGVSGCCSYPTGERIGQFPKNRSSIDATNLQRARFRLRGDKAEAYKTEILRKYPFPEYSGESFLTEAVVWDRIAQDGYKLRWFPDIIYIADYLSDGLSRNLDKQRLDSFCGWTLYVRQSAGNRSLPEYSSMIGEYCRLAGMKGMTKQEICQAVGISKEKVFICAMICTAKKLIKKYIKKRI